MRIALYQPDIPQNTGTILRLGACMGVGVDIIEPCGFPFSDRALRRAGMDYMAHVDLCRHLSWDAFVAAHAAKQPSARIILLTTRGATDYTEQDYRDNDVLLLGQEGAGVPQAVQDRADVRVRIPMTPGMRSINVAVAAAMVVGEGLRQTGQFPVRLDNGDNR